MCNHYFLVFYRHSGLQMRLQQNLDLLIQLQINSLRLREIIFFKSSHIKYVDPELKLHKFM